MDMQGKIQKASFYVFIGYFLFVLASVFFQIPDAIIAAVNILAITELYGSKIISYYMSAHKFSFLLAGLFLLYLGWYGSQILLGNAAWSGNQVITLILAYTYVIVAEKMTNGKVSKRIICISVFFIGIEGCKLLVAGAALNMIATVAQVVMILILVDPMMKRVAQKGAKKREESTLEYKRVPLTRRILFGKTGTLRLDMITGTKSPFQNENEGNHSHSSRKDHPLNITD